MKDKLRKTISSSIGSIDFGHKSMPQRKVLKVEEESSLNQYPNSQQFNTNSQSAQKQLSFGAPPLEQNYQDDFEEPSIEDMERQVAFARNQKKETESRASKSSVQRLEILTGIGRLVCKETIENVEFHLRSLKSREMKKVLEIAALEKTNIGEVMIIRNYTLAFSLFKIDNDPIERYINSYDFSDKVALIDEFEESVISRLWNKYREMISDHKDNIKNDLGEDPETIINTVKK